MKCLKKMPLNLRPGAFRAWARQPCPIENLLSELRFKAMYTHAHLNFSARKKLTCGKGWIFTATHSLSPAKSVLLGQGRSEGKGFCLSLGWKECGWSPSFPSAIAFSSDGCVLLWCSSTHNFCMDEFVGCATCLEVWQTHVNIDVTGNGQHCLTKWHANTHMRSPGFCFGNGQRLAMLCILQWLASLMMLTLHPLPGSKVAPTTVRRCSVMVSSQSHLKDRRSLTIYEKRWYLIISFPPWMHATSEQAVTTCVTLMSFSAVHCVAAALLLWRESIQRLPLWSEPNSLQNLTSACPSTGRSAEAVSCQHYLPGDVA